MEITSSIFVDRIVKSMRPNRSSSGQPLRIPSLPDRMSYIRYGLQVEG
jgi:hypothetical protein